MRRGIADRPRGSHRAGRGARRRGGDGRAPEPVRRAARAVHAGTEPGRRAWGAARRGDRPMMVALLLVVILSVTLISGPAQRYLDSSSRVEGLETKVGALEEENARLEQRKEDLTDDEYVELLAREQQGLIRPGEVPYTLVPPPVDRPRIAAPQETAGEPDQAWYRRAWETVSGWLG